MSAVSEKVPRPPTNLEVAGKEKTRELSCQQRFTHFVDNTISDKNISRYNNHNNNF